MNISQNLLYPKNSYLGIQSKTQDVENGMLDLATQMLMVIGVCALPFIFMGYVRSRVRHVLETTGKRVNLNHTS